MTNDWVRFDSHRFPRAGKQWAIWYAEDMHSRFNAGRVSPDHRWIAIQSWSGEHCLRCGNGYRDDVPTYSVGMLLLIPPLVAGTVAVEGSRALLRLPASYLFVDIYDVRSEARLLSIRGKTHRTMGWEPLGHARWLTTGQYVLPVGIDMNELLVCDPGTKVP